MGHRQESSSPFSTINGMQIRAYSKHLNWESAKLLGGKKKSLLLFVISCHNSNISKCQECMQRDVCFITFSVEFHVVSSSILESGNFLVIH